MTMLDAKTIDEFIFEDSTSSGTSNPINFSDSKYATVHYTAESVSGGATILVQGSLDNSSWVTLDTEIIGTSGITEFALTNRKLKFVRGNISSYTDGTYNVRIFAGN